MVLNALHDMRVAGQHLAVIVDEYGGTDGIVTLEDLVSEIVGEMTGGPTRPAVALTNGQVIQVDGRLNLDDFAEATGIELPAGPYDTAAGYLMAGLGRLAEAGDSIVWMDRRLTVTAMDGRRIARIDISTVAR